MLHIPFVVGMLLIAVSTSAQTPREGDPISGDWGIDSSRRLELTFDGKETVTGTVFLFRGGTQRASAPIKTGAFDPRSRFLKLEGEIVGPDGKMLPYVIEGTLDNDTLDVAYTFGTDAGKMILQKLSAHSR